jgi:hypothetical protein
LSGDWAAACLAAEPDVEAVAAPPRSCEVELDELAELEEPHAASESVPAAVISAPAITAAALGA